MTEPKKTYKPGWYAELKNCETNCENEVVSVGLGLFYVSETQIERAELERRVLSVRDMSGCVRDFDETRMVGPISPVLDLSVAFKQLYTQQAKSNLVNASREHLRSAQAYAAAADGTTLYPWDDEGDDK